MIKLTIVGNIILFCFILIELYAIHHRGKFIIKTQSKKIPIMWTIILLIYGVMFIGCIIDYLNKVQVDRKEFLNSIFFIQAFIVNSRILNRSLGITKKGLMLDSFYKWDEIKNYEWIYENTISFKIKTSESCTSIVNKELEVKDEQKTEVSELLKKYVKPISSEELLSLHEDKEDSEIFRKSSKILFCLLNIASLIASIVEKDSIFIVMSLSITFAVIYIVKDLDKNKKFRIVKWIAFILFIIYTFHKIILYSYKKDIVRYNTSTKNSCITFISLSKTFLSKSSFI